MRELDFTRAEYDTAMESNDEAALAKLSHHPSRYIRARVAGNPHTARSIRDALRINTEKHSSILSWILGNPACTREEFECIYKNYSGRSYDGNVHLALASSHHATLSELSELLRQNHWCITMAVLNNYKGRTLEDFQKLIKRFLPNEDTPWEKWREEEKLAYFRTTGRRHPQSQD